MTKDYPQRKNYMFNILKLIFILTFAVSFAYASGKQVRFPSPTVEICEVEPDSEICEDLDEE